MTLAKEQTPGEKARESLPGVTIHGLQDAKRLMKAAEWHGKQNVQVSTTHVQASLPADQVNSAFVATYWHCIVRLQRKRSSSLVACADGGSTCTAGNGPGACWLRT